ncbi:hypothetical protein NQZ68_033112 [Dissostichus eleginoides]|nr:hypothetical protein NQZ68_033112 [Dissostichus eleginoides]
MSIQFASIQSVVDVVDVLDVVQTGTKFVNAQSYNAKRFENWWWSGMNRSAIYNALILDSEEMTQQVNEDYSAASSERKPKSRKQSFDEEFKVFFKGKCFLRHPGRRAPGRPILPKALHFRVCLISRCLALTTDHQE